jgi:hypothetical protein
MRNMRSLKAKIRFQSPSSITRVQCLHILTPCILVHMVEVAIFLAYAFIDSMERCSTLYQTGTVQA